jgi:hypothetical protein
MPRIASLRKILGGPPRELRRPALGRGKRRAGAHAETVEMFGIALPSIAKLGSERNQAKKNVEVGRIGECDGVNVA